MLYYRTPAQLDGRQICTDRKKSVYFSFVAGELFTPSECRKYGIDPAILIPEEVSKRKVYFCFGARFKM